MTKRKSLSKSGKVKLFKAHGGICHVCAGKIQVGEAWDADHVIPLEMGGEDGGENLKPAHVKCHRAKTRKDAGDIAKAKRREANNIGAKQSRNPMPGSKRSGWKKRMDGTVERRI